MNKYSVTKLGILAGLLLALEMTLLQTFAFGGARAEALLALACLAALFARDTRQGLLAAWVIGLFKDVGSSGPLGLHALLFLGAGWVVMQVRQVLFRENALTQLTVGFVAACWVNLVSALFVCATAGAIPFGVIAGKTLLSGLLTAGLTPVLYLIFSSTRWLVR